VKIGFLSVEYKDEIVEFAKNIGFDCMEVFADCDSDLNLDVLSDADIDRVVKHFENCGVEIGTVCCSINLLDGDLSLRERNITYMKKMIEKVKRFGTDIITTNTWGNKDLTPEENLPLYKEIYSPIAELCEKHDVRIAFENCPHFVGYPVPLGNIGYSPEMWDALFDAVPSDHIGLEFDPSHLYWLGIDYIRALREYADKVFAFHAKDTEIMPEEQYRYGVIGKQFGKTSEWDAGFYRYRIPGWGNIEWKEIYKVFYDIGFDGPIIIEHEDPVFDGDLRPVGLKMGHDYLRQFELPVIASK